MGRIKVVLLVFPVIALCLLFWPAGRKLLRKLFIVLLWTFCAISTTVGAVVFFDAKGDFSAILGGFLLWVFSAYAAWTAKSIKQDGVPRHPDWPHSEGERSSWWG